MARMHTGKHGKSKSRKPDVEVGGMPDNVKLTREEIDEKIANYAKQGLSPALIGQYLKDRDNVPYIKQIYGKRLVAILKEKKLATELPPDMLDLMRKAVNMRKHLSTNRQDVHNNLRLVRVESKIWRLTKYYKKEGRLPGNWRYDPEKAALIIKG